MASAIATLCDAVTAFLNAQTYSQTFTATRSNSPVNQLEDTNDIIVTVFPGDYTVDIESRETWLRTYSVFIAIQKVVDDRDDQDELLELAEEIEDSLQDEDMSGMTMYSLAGTIGSRTPVQPDQLLMANQFVTVLEVQYVG